MRIKIQKRKVNKNFELPWTRFMKRLAIPQLGIMINFCIQKVKQENNQ